MAKAARLNDPIGHSPSMNWLVKGLLIGGAIAVAGVAIAGTGGLAAAAIVGGAAAGGAGIGELMSTMSWAPKEIAGAIVGAGSGNVYINGRPAVRAHLDKVACDKHSGTPPIATGSSKVFINGLPAARVGDKTGCGGDITDGSGDVFIGGGTLQTDVIHPEDLVPGWVHATLFVVGAAAAVVLAGPVVATLGLVGGLAGGAGGGWLGGSVWGEGSDGQKWAMLGGSLVGGAFGAKGGVWFNKNYVVATEGLGANFGNIKIRPKADSAVGAVEESQAALSRATKAYDDLPHALKGKTVGSDGEKTLSGWGNKPEGFRNVSPEEVAAHAKEIGHNLKPAGAMDQVGQGGFEGKYHASHAEKQS